MATHLHPGTKLPPYLPVRLRLVPGHIWAPLDPLNNRWAGI
jgi:hypothetical protein